jgi:hypothetical protein
MSSSLSRSEEPPDPEAARLAAKVRLLMLISALTTVIAVGAVLVVIGYRVFRAEGSAEAADVVAALPAGARVVSTAVADGRIVVTVDIGGRTEIHIFELKTLRPMGRLKFTTAP